MNRKLIFLGMAVFLLAFSLVVISCGNGLVGTWEDENDNSSILVLSKDGTGTWDKQGITWKTEKKLLMITGMGMSFSYGYKLSGSTLTLVGVSGDDETYTLKRKAR
jgi:hypothetical protein